MNDNSIEYAKMIEIPLSSCEYERQKRGRFFAKKNLIKRVNEDLLNASCQEEAEPTTQTSPPAQPTADDIVLKERGEKRSKKRALEGGDGIKSKIITAQIIASFALAVAIILTNVFWENSGMNTLFRSVFETRSEKDDRSAWDFSLNLPTKSEGVTLENGVLTVSGEYSIYPVCEGRVDSVQKNADGSFTLTLVHSETFSSIIEGADLVYFSEGDEVNKSVPICHTSTTARVYLYENGSLLTNLVAVENSILLDK